LRDAGCELRVAIKIEPVYLCTCIPMYLYTCIQRLRLINARSAWRFFLRMVSVRAENAVTHPRIAREICDRDALQAQRPRGQQMKSAVPREIVNPRGGLEEDDRRARRLWFLARNFSRHRRDLEIIEPADKSAFDALGEKLFHPALTNHYFFHNLILPTNPLLHP